MGIDTILEVGGLVISAHKARENFYPIVSRTLKYALKISNLLPPKPPGVYTHEYKPVQSYITGKA